MSRAEVRASVLVLFCVAAVAALSCEEPNPAFRLRDDAVDAAGGEVGGQGGRPAVDAGFIPVGGGGAIAGAIAGAAGSATPPLDLIAHWDFDEGAGKAAQDNSPHKNNGTLVGDAAWAETGRMGAALSLSGTGYVVVPDSASLDTVTGAYTVMAWARPAASTSPQWRVLVSRQLGETNGEHYGLGFSATGVPASFCPVGAVREAAPAPTDIWMHVAAVFDGAMLRLFINGEERGTSIAGAAPAADINPLVIGGNANGSDHLLSEGFTGLIDDVRLYRRALTPGEIAQLVK